MSRYAIIRPTLRAALIIFAFCPLGSALPPFARKYNTSCTTCHVIVPKLNAFGVAFRNNGYRIPFEDEKFVKQEETDLGAPAWKQVWPRGVWPSSIASQVPLALGLLSHVNIDPNARASFDFVFPEHLQVSGAGTLGDNASYLATLHFMFMETMTDAQFLRGHVAFHRLRRDPLLNLRVGRFELGASPFSRFTKKLTDSDYMATQFQTTSGGFQLSNPQSGFELFGAQTGFRNSGGFEYSVGLVNGSNRMYDNNSQKDFYASAAYKFGGYGLMGSREELTELKASENYIDNSLTIGGFGYIGRSDSPFVGEVRFNRWGLRADLSIQKLNLYGAYVHGSDTLMSRGTRQMSNAYFVEGDYVILPWIIALVRYDQVLLGEPGARPPSGGGHPMLMPSELILFRLGQELPRVYHTLAGDILPRKRLVPALVFAVRANVTLSVEGVFPTGVTDPVMRSNPQMRKHGRVGLKFYF